MEGIATYVPGGTGVGYLQINLNGGTIQANSPIIIEVVNFDPSSSFTVET